jgi:hypothetical protein
MPKLKSKTILGGKNNMADFLAASVVQKMKLCDDQLHSTICDTDIMYCKLQFVPFDSRNQSTVVPVYYWNVIYCTMYIVHGIFIIEQTAADPYQIYADQVLKIYWSMMQLGRFQEIPCYDDSNICWHSCTVQGNCNQLMHNATAVHVKLLYCWRVC